MSLDIAILDSEGRPDKYVSIGVKLHHELVHLSREHALDVINRLHHYYQDAEIPVDELTRAIDQIDILQNLDASDALLDFLHGFREIAVMALEAGVSLHSISD